MLKSLPTALGLLGLFAIGVKMDIYPTWSWFWTLSPIAAAIVITFLNATFGRIGE